MRGLPGLLALLLLAAPAARAALPSDLEAQVQAIVDHALLDSGTPGASVAVVAEGRVVAEVASGLADRDAQVLATTGTVYPAASVSKLLTAVLVMQQVEGGKITLDSAVNQYLVPARWVRDSSGEPVGVTLRQLLSHTSGLPVAFERGIPEPGEAPLSLDEYLANGLEVVQPAGEKIIYANEGFSLAGYLAARLEGKDFQGLARERLFAPLALVNSTFYPRFDLDQRLAGAHPGPFSGTEQQPQVDFTAMAPAGSLRTTAGDLARFALMCLAGGTLDGVRVLRPESLREMWTVQARAHPDLDEGFGLGFAVSERPGRRMVWWDGFLPGVASRLAILPDHGLAVAVLTNAGDPAPVNAIAEGVFSLLAGPEAAPAFSADPDALDALSGEYRIYDVLPGSLWYLAPFSNLRLEARDGALQARLLVGDAFARLEPVAPNLFRVDGGILHGRSVLIEDGRIFLTFLSGRRLAWFERSEALAVYGISVVVLLLALLGTGLWRGLRRLRRTSS